MEKINIQSDSANENWDKVIGQRQAFSFKGLKEIYAYRDLLFLFVRRDFVAAYKQTILGPLWHFVQPTLTTITFSFIFGRIAGLPTGDVPRPLFYMSGIIVWFIFADAVRKSSNIFIANSHIFSKVYFPRLIFPVASLINTLLSFSVQSVLFFGLLIYYTMFTGLQIDLHPEYIPLVLLMLFIAGILGMSIGLIVSTITVKYRDAAFLVGFGIQLLMYFSPVIFPMSSVSNDYRWIIELNPMTSVVECFRYVFLGTGDMDMYRLIYTCVFTITLFFLSFIIFNRVERNFTDTL